MSVVTVSGLAIAALEAAYGYEECLSDVREHLYRAGVSVSRYAIARVLSELAGAASAGHFIGNDLFDEGYAQEDMLAPLELAYVVRGMLGMWWGDFGENHQEFLLGLASDERYNRTDSSRIIYHVVEAGADGNPPLEVTPHQFGAALAGVLGNADDPEYLRQLLAVI